MNLNMYKPQYSRKKSHPLLDRKRRTVGNHGSSSHAKVERPAWNNDLGNVSRFSASAKEILQRKISTISPRNPRAKELIYKYLSNNGSLRAAADGSVIMTIDVSRCRIRW